MKKILLPLFLLICVIGKTQNGFTTYSCTLTGSALQFNNRSCIAMDNANNIWIGFNNTSPIRLIKFDGTTWTDHSGSAPTNITALAADGVGNLWIGTASAGIAKYDGTTFTAFNQGNSSIIGNNILGLAVINNMLFIGTTAGFSEFDGITNFTNYSTSNSALTSNSIYCFEKEGTQIWIGTGHGLHSYSGSIVAYTGDTSRVNDIMIDGAGKKWLGTESSGIHTYDNSTFSLFSLPLVIGGRIPARIRGIGTSINGNPIINIERFSVSTYVKNGLLEVLPGSNYHFFPHHDFVPYECVFVADASGSLWYTDARPVAGSGGSSTLAKKCLHRFQQNLYNPAAEISTITPENTQFLDINNVSAACNPGADIHGDDTQGFYEVPKGSGSQTTHGSAFWMGGYVNGQLRIAANTYRQNGVDFWPGPIDTNTGATDTATAQQFNRVWKVNRFDIENFKFNYLIGNVQNGTFPIPNEILTWPGNGSVWGEMLAPYFDYDNNNYYDPHYGDYPLIKGDQMIWWVFNDALAGHTETGSVSSMRVQVQASAYAYTCPSIADSDKVINYTTFYNYKIINKGTDVIDSIRVGIWSDVDLGNYNDDYVGCDVQNNFGFVYNGDNFDDSVNGVTGYLANTPYFSYNVLKGPEADMNDGLDNDHDGCIDCTFELDGNGNPTTTQLDDDIIPEPTSMNVFIPYNNTGDARTGNPLVTGNGIQYYRYLSGIWKDGTPMRYDNGNGTSLSGPGCTYMYPGASDPIGYGVGGSPASPATPFPSWTEGNSMTNNQPGDRRFLSSSGKFTLYPGGIKEFDFAYVFTQDATELANGTLYNKVVSDNQKVQKWFTLNNAPSCLDLNGIGLKESGKKIQMLVFPNPASSNLTIDAGNSNTILKLKVYDILGKEIFAQENIRTTKSQLNISSLNSGVYLLEVQSEQGAYFTKFVKQ